MFNPCVLGVSSEPLFKGRNANCTQRGAPALTVLRHTPTLSHKMLYPPTLVGVFEQICRSSEARRGPPLARVPGYVPKSLFRSFSGAISPYVLRFRPKNTHENTHISVIFFRTFEKHVFSGRKRIRGCL